MYKLICARRWRPIGHPVAIAVVMAILGGFVVSRTFPHPALFETGPGGFRQAALADGSTVQVNTRSALKVWMDRDVRHIALMSGEAHFKVAADATWPFVVVAGDTVIRAVGTEFSVRIWEPGRAVVMVGQGVVAVSHVESPMGERAVFRRRGVPLTGGQLVHAKHSVTDQGGRMALEELTHEQVSAREAWRRDMLQFNGEPLRAVVEEINRYNVLRLEIADQRIDGQPISGQFRPREVERFLGTLEKLMGTTTESADENGRRVVRIYGPAK